MFGWYKQLNDALAPAKDLIVLLAVALIAVTAFLLLSGQWALLTAWIVYMYSP